MACAACSTELTRISLIHAISALAPSKESIAR
jgi:hypothetical protein